MKNSRFAMFFSATGLAGLFVALIGAALLVLGVQLITLGGSWYYALAGLSLVASGVLLVKKRYDGLTVYGVVLVATLIWAIAEVGFDGWKLMPRLFAPAVLGFFLFLPFISTHLAPRFSHDKIKFRSRIGAAFCAVIAVGVIALGYATSASNHRQFEKVADASPAVQTVAGAEEGDRRYYGRTPDGGRFSPLKQITPDNVKNLQVAWTYRTGDLATKVDTEKGREFSFETTPIKIGDNLYFCTGHAHTISLNATTGAKNWEFDPKSDTAEDVFHVCRGVAYVETPDDAACPRRIISPTGDPRLVALNADTGKPCESFGDKGFVNLTDHMGIVPPGFHYITSQPLALGNRIMIGGWVYDNEATGEPSGVVRALDAVSGKLVWAWDLGKADPTAPLKPGEEHTRGTPNAWGTYTADEKLGLVYLPTGNATPDYFGGHRRPFDDAYSSAIVALDIQTGKERWHFQTVHHDLWDFDLTNGPSLVDLNTPQGDVPALVQNTKRGDFFVLDRRTGKPLSEIEERPVPQGAAEGEYLSKTQPFQPGFPSLAPADVTEQDTWGATPIDQLLCRIDFKQRHYQGPFTPPKLGKYLAFPAFFGVTNWYGPSIDPARKLLIINSSTIPMAMDYLKIEEAMKDGKVAPWKGWGNPFPPLIHISNNPQYGTPYSIHIEPWLNALGVPCIAPPWGKLTAIDLNTRKIAWERPFGTTRKSGLFNTHLGVPLPTGITSMGGNVITAGGLVFIGASADEDFRAFDEKTGAMLWQDHLPAGGNANPMTYTGKDGDQYVVIAAGGHGGIRTTQGDYVIAYRLAR